MYKDVWSPEKGGKLAARSHEQEEASAYDKYIIGIYKKKDHYCEESVGNISLEIPSLLYHFL